MTAILGFARVRTLGVTTLMRSCPPLRRGHRIPPQIHRQTFSCGKHRPSGPCGPAALRPRRRHRGGHSNRSARPICRRSSPHHRNLGERHITLRSLREGIDTATATADQLPHHGDPGQARTRAWSRTLSRLPRGATSTPTTAHQTTEANRRAPTTAPPLSRPLVAVAATRATAFHRRAVSTVGRYSR